MPELRMNFIFLLLFFSRMNFKNTLLCFVTKAETTSVGEGSDGNGPLPPWRNPLS